MNFCDSILIRALDFPWFSWQMGSHPIPKKENIYIYITELVIFSANHGRVACFSLYIHFKKSHSSMFTASTFPNSPTLPSYSFKALLSALVSQILGAVHPNSRPRAMWAWHSLVEKRNATDVTWSESMPMMWEQSTWEPSCWAGNSKIWFYFVKSVTAKRAMNQWIAARQVDSEAPMPRTMPSPCRPVPAHPSCWDWCLTCLLTLPNTDVARRRQCSTSRILSDSIVLECFG